MPRTLLPISICLSALVLLYLLTAPFVLFIWVGPSNRASLPTSLSITFDYLRPATWLGIHCPPYAHYTEAICDRADRAAIEWENRKKRAAAKGKP